jgi:hypothetical protein
MLARERLGPFLEAVDALGDERPDGALEDELNQDLVRVERSGALAGGLVGDDVDLPFVLDDMVLQQALIDRTKLLHPQVAVVDASAAVAGERVEQGRESSIGQLDPIEERSDLRVEQPAIVRRQSERRLTLLDRAKQAAQAGIVVADARGECVFLVNSPGDFVPDRAEAVVVIASIAHRKQVTILCVQHEEQPVEQGQRRVLQLLEIFARTRRRPLEVGRVQRRDEIRKKPAEHQVGQALCDPLFPASTLVKREQMEGAVILADVDERGPAKHEREHPKPVRTAFFVALGQQVGESGKI